MFDEADLLEYITNNDIEIALAAARSEHATEPILDIATHACDERGRMATLNNPNIGNNALRFLLNAPVESIVMKTKEIMERRK